MLPLVLPEVEPIVVPVVLPLVVPVVEPVVLPIEPLVLPDEPMVVLPLVLPEVVPVWANAAVETRPSPRAKAAARSGRKSCFFMLEREKGESWKERYGTIGRCCRR
jgi:hypothetical protein